MLKASLHILLSSILRFVFDFFDVVIISAYLIISNYHLYIGILYKRFTVTYFYHTRQNVLHRNFLNGSSTIHSRN